MRISTRAFGTESPLFHSLLDRSSNSIFLVEPETGNVLDVNERACESLGYSRDELLDMRVLDIGSSIDSEFTWQEHLTMLRRKGSVTLTEYHRRKNGTRIPVRLNIDLLEEEGEEYILAVAQPIEDHDEMGVHPDEEDLRFQTLFENLSVPCSIYDLSPLRDFLEDNFDYDSLTENGRLTITPDIIEEAVATATSFATNDAFDDFFHSNRTADESVNILNRLPFENGIKRVLRKLLEGQNHFQFETDVSVHSDETIPVIVEVTVAPGHEHRWSRVYFTLTDISERRHFKKQLSRSERTFEQITKKIEQIVWMFDPNLENLLYHNGPVEDIYGCTPEAIHSDSQVLLEMIHPEDRDRVRSKISAMINGRSIDVEYRVNPHENYSRWAWTQGIPLTDGSGSVDRVAGFTKDITSRKRMEFSLRKTKERYQSIFDQAQVGMAEISTDGRWLRVNTRLSDLLGYSKNELYQMTHTSITHPDDLEQCNRLEQKLLDGDIDNFTREKRFYRKDGDPVWVKQTTSLVRDESGEPLYFIAVMENIQHQREAEQELKRRETRYRNLVTDVPGIVYRCLLDDNWTMRFMSEDVEAITGYPREDLIGNKNRSFDSIIHSGDRAEVRAAVKNAVEEDRPFEIEYRIETRDEGIRWVLERGRAITDPETDERVLHGVIIDVTDTKQAQQELQQSEERYRSLFEQAKVGMAEISFDETWLSVNERLEEILGYSEQELLNQTCREITHPDSVEKDQRCARKLIEGETDYFTTEKRYQHREGHWVWVRMTVSRVDNPRAGHDGYFVAIIEDISEQKEAQRELRRSERRFRELTRTIDQVVWILDQGLNQLEYLGPGLEGIWGQPAGHFEDVPEGLLETVHPEDRSEIGAIFPSSGESASELEFRIQRPDGQVRWVRERTFSFGGGDGSGELIAGTFEDITERKLAEKELRESEQRFRSTFEQAAVGMAHVGLDGSLLRLNEKFCELTGYSHEELKSLSFQEITHPDDLEHDLEQVDKLIDGVKDQYSMEKRYLRKDGSVFWAQLTVSVVRNEDGEAQYFVSVIEDISDRKETEEQLKKSEEKFRELAENIDEVFWLSDPDKEEILYVSPAIKEIWDIDQDVLYQNPQLWLDRIHPEDQNRIRKDLVRRQRNGEYDEEYRIVLPDDTIRWIRDRAFPIEDEDGNVQRIAGIAEDVTKKKRIQEEQETFFNISIDLFALANYEGQFLDVNSAFRETLGYSRSELTSRSFLEFVHPEDVEETREIMGQLEDGKPLEGFENRYITKDGNIRWLNWRAEPGDDMIYAVARDVTERRQYEDQLQSMVDEKETLLKEIHHRVKNNLQMISSMLDMQMREIGQESLREKLRDSVNRIKSMALIHENLYQSDNLADLDFTRYIQELTERTLNVHQQVADQVDIDYDVDSEPLDLDHAIPCGLVLNELISNALEHGIDDNKDGRVSITFRNKQQMATLTVRDNGEGFPEDLSLEETDTFGMQIVRSLVEYELDGEISHHNDNGAVVDVSFPV